MKNRHLLFILCIFFLSCKQSKTCDLIIINANILDVVTGQISENKSIIINNGKIENIVDHKEDYNPKKTIDANHKLVTPSFIDTHIHPTDVFGDREKAPKYLNKNS